MGKQDVDRELHVMFVLGDLTSDDGHCGVPAL